MSSWSEILPSISTAPGEILFHPQMCAIERTNLQRGMNYRLSRSHSVILMSTRKGAPYRDRIDDDGRVLIYEGHDVPNRRGGVDSKTVDQPMSHFGGSLTQNGLFYRAARDFQAGNRSPEIVRVYEKIKDGIWVFNGEFSLTDAWQESDGTRLVFKFRLELASESDVSKSNALPAQELSHTRMIPSKVKQEVWARDRGKCVLCGQTDNLHFDHIIPFSKGGSSLVAENIQLLCARHNLEKHDKIV